MSVKCQKVKVVAWSMWSKVDRRYVWWLTIQIVEWWWWWWWCLCSELQFTM